MEKAYDECCIKCAEILLNTAISFFLDKDPNAIKDRASNVSVQN